LESNIMTITKSEASPIVIGDMDRPVWGAKGVAEILEVPIHVAFYMLEKGLVDADKIGRKWRSTPRRLLAKQARVAG
jgi:hypothetical protein